MWWVENRRCGNVQRMGPIGLMGLMGWVVLVLGVGLESLVRPKSILSVNDFNDQYRTPLSSTSTRTIILSSRLAASPTVGLDPPSLLE
jgi:hypothetical protein